MSSLSKTRAARLAIASNTLLIAVKLAAGILTGSVSVLSDAVHSGMDLVASVISLVSVRKADEPADASHRYGHEGLEDLSAGAQAILLLISAVFIVYEGTVRLIHGGGVRSAGVGIAVVGVSAGVNLIVSAMLRRTAHSAQSAALSATAADLRSDAAVSLGVLAALLAVKVTGAQWLDAATGMLVGVAICATGVRILVAALRRLSGETLPADELAQLHQVARGFIGDEVAGYHDLRARHVGSSHQVDLHMQFAVGTTLERAHELSHQLQDAMTAALPGTTVLIHLEPEDRCRADRFEHGDEPLLTVGTQPPSATGESGGWQSGHGTPAEQPTVTP